MTYSRLIICLFNFPNFATKMITQSACSLCIAKTEMKPFYIIDRAERSFTVGIIDDFIQFLAFKIKIGQF